MESCVVHPPSAQTRLEGYVGLAELPRPASTPWNTFDLSSMGLLLSGLRLPARSGRITSPTPARRPAATPFPGGRSSIQGARKSHDARGHTMPGPARPGGRVRLAEEVRRTFWIGTSGWQYDSWKGRFYPRNLPKSGWLAFYAERFATVEVNNSFYRLPSD